MAKKMDLLKALVKMGNMVGVKRHRKTWNNEKLDQIKEFQNSWKWNICGL